MDWQQDGCISWPRWKHQTLVCWHQVKVIELLVEK
jgi:hypothetical protein